MNLYSTSNTTPHVLKPPTFKAAYEAGIRDGLEKNLSRAERMEREGRRAAQKSLDNMLRYGHDNVELITADDKEKAIEQLYDENVNLYWLLRKSQSAVCVLAITSAILYFVLLYVLFSDHVPPLKP